MIIRFSLFWRCINERCWGVICRSSYCLWHSIFQGIFSFGMVRIYDVIGFMLFVIDSLFLCAECFYRKCVSVWLSMFAQSSSLFEYRLAGKLDYLQDKCKHMLSPTSDCCSLMHIINILHFALMPMALIFHTLNFASIDSISASWCQCNFQMKTITQITNWITLNNNGFAF